MEAFSCSSTCIRGKTASRMSSSLACTPHARKLRRQWRLGRQPGFADAPDGFHIDEYRLDQDQWAEGYVVVAGA